ncbi:MAG TPA: HAD-IA family hydrolase [Coleofasciculaceae cyanobacterium]
MSVKIILFDFDGTIADTFDALVTITNRLAKDYRYKPATPEEIDHLRSLSSWEIFKRSGISVFRLPSLLKRVQEDLHQYIHQLNPVSGIKEALIELKAEGHTLGILTSNSQENVILFLKNHEMLELFSFIGSETTIFSKHRILRRFIRKNRLIPDDVIYVGDETRDIEASKKIPIKIIAVSWGFNSKEALVKSHPDFLIHHPSELIEVMGTLQKVV